MFLGTSAFAATVLERLAVSAHCPVLALTRPDRPRGRGRHLTPPPVAEAARALEVELLQPEDVGSPESRRRISAIRPDTVIVCAFGALIREPLLSEHPIVNVHPSLLPRWRGAAPIERAIMAGDALTGVSIMELTAGLDSGPVLAQAQLPIAAADSYGTLAPRLAALGAELLIGVLDEPPRPVAQSEDGVTYAEKIASEDRRLDPARPAVELERMVRALTPHIGAYLEDRPSGRLGVLAARALTAGPPAGELFLEGEAPLLGTADGGLELLVVQPPGKRPMPGEDYLRGRRR